MGKRHKHVRAHIHTHKSSVHTNTIQTNSSRANGLSYQRVLARKWNLFYTSRKMRSAAIVIKIKVYVRPHFALSLENVYQSSVVYFCKVGLLLSSPMDWMLLTEYDELEPSTHHSKQVYGKFQNCLNICNSHNFLQKLHKERVSLKPSLRSIYVSFKCCECLSIHNSYNSLINLRKEPVLLKKSVRSTFVSASFLITITRHLLVPPASKL